MTIDTNLAGRLRNTHLAASKGLLPLLEAVVNSLQAIDEANITSEKGRISVHILRQLDQESLPFDEGSKKRGKTPMPEIAGFRVWDNGVGFTAENMDSFRTLDSDRKAAQGGRGIGRLLWLKAFSQVTVESFYRDDAGAMKRRSFRFSPTSGVEDEQTEPVDSEPTVGTTVHLDGFLPTYRHYSPKTAQSIAQAIVENCLWYFLRGGGAPVMTVVDGESEHSLGDLFDDYMHDSAVTEEVDIKEEMFYFIHVKLRAHSKQTHSIALCADNRLVLEEKLAGRIPGLHGELSDDQGSFTYSCYVNSNFLNERVRPERTGFELIASEETLFAGTEITKEDIEAAVIERAKEHLADQLADNVNRAAARVQEFVSKKAPRYRPILPRIPEEQLSVDPDISDKDLDLTLHKHLAEIEAELLREGHDIMAPKTGESLENYGDRLAQYLSKAEDIKKSDLAGYVAHRKVVLDLLERAIRPDDDGKYAREDMIHGLIMPMRADSSDVLLDRCNLWIVDERLAFHDYLASDKTLASIPITGSKETKEPDICALNLFDNPVLVSEGQHLPLASIIVVEIKRPMRNDASSGEIDDPIEQALGYLERIREGKVQTADGRPIPHSDDIPGFCYVICDLTPSIIKRCKVHDLTRTSDGLGYFAYKASFKSYVEVIGFDRLVSAAKERNRAFFDKLGLPIS